MGRAHPINEAFVSHPVDSVPQVARAASTVGSRAGMSPTVEGRDDDDDWSDPADRAVEGTLDRDDAAEPGRTSGSSSARVPSAPASPAAAAATGSSSSPPSSSLSSACVCTAWCKAAPSSMALRLKYLRKMCANFFRNLKWGKEDTFT